MGCSSLIKNKREILRETKKRLKGQEKDRDNNKWPDVDIMAERSTIDAECRLKHFPATSIKNCAQS